MRLIIAGSREITDYELVANAIADSDFHPIEIDEVVSGTARGVDQLGEQWANLRGIPVKRFVPDWNKHGKAAGPIRNQAMARYANALVLIWDGESRGSASMKREALKCGLKIHEHII